MIPAQPADSTKTTFETNMNQAMNAATTEATIGNEREAMDPASAKAAIESVDPPIDLPDPNLTENAKTVLGRRYLKKSPETGEVVETPRQLFWRVASHVAKAELSFNAGAWPQSREAETGTPTGLLNERSCLDRIENAVDGIFHR